MCYRSTWRPCLWSWSYSRSCLVSEIATHSSFNSLEHCILMLHHFRLTKFSRHPETHSSATVQPTVIRYFLISCHWRVVLLRSFTVPFPTWPKLCRCLGIGRCFPSSCLGFNNWGFFWLGTMRKKAQDRKHWRQNWGLSEIFCPIKTIQKRTRHRA